MTIKTSILLPSQESLLHRLQHIALYGQQLTVLTGESGAGKTTLVTALVDELDGVSTALVACPQHADSSEIRRKILVQLLSDPLFDDEMPLPETLLDLAGSLPSHCHIVLDDAHYLPLEIWAECIVLSQLGLSGKSISLTLTTSRRFLAELLTQLPQSQQQVLLAVSIDPLVMSERETLYYSLLQRSEQAPFTPKEIVQQQLLAQEGLPGDVVKLLYLALDGDEEEPRSRPNYLWIWLTVALLLSVSVGFIYLKFKSPVAQSTPEQTVASLKAGIKNYTYGEALLTPYFMARLDSVQAAREAQKPADIEDATADLAAADNTLSTEHDSPKPEETEAAQHIPVQEDSAHASRVEVFAAHAVNPLDDNPRQFDTFHPDSGYTIQLVSVKQVQSLDAVMDQLDSVAELKVAKYHQYWILLYGQYHSRAEAKAQAKLLQQQLQVGSLWIREWADLSQYQLQQTVPAREI